MLREGPWADIVWRAACYQERLREALGRWGRGDLSAIAQIELTWLVAMRELNALHYKSSPRIERTLKRLEDALKAQDLDAAWEVWWCLEGTGTQELGNFGTWAI